MNSIPAGLNAPQEVKDAVARVWNALVVKRPASWTHQQCAAFIGLFRDEARVSPWTDGQGNCIGWWIPMENSGQILAEIKES